LTVGWFGSGACPVVVKSSANTTLKIVTEAFLHVTLCKRDESADFHGYGTVMMGAAISRVHYQYDDAYRVLPISSVV
jgi:hypothetical protein